MSRDKQTARVLVVDDEPSIVDAIATTLRYEGFEVDQASNGRAALRAAQEKPFDLIVLDIMMPDIDGLEVTKRLRAGGVRVPVLFLTARDSVEDKGRGADGRRRRLRREALLTGGGSRSGTRHPSPNQGVF